MKNEESKKSQQAQNKPKFDELMHSIEKYVKLESNKKATISTIGKLIKFTKEK